MKDHKAEHHKHKNYNVQPVQKDKSCIEWIGGGRLNINSPNKPVQISSFLDMIPAGGPQTMCFSYLGRHAATSNPEIQSYSELGLSTEGVAIMKYKVTGSRA